MKQFIYKKQCIKNNTTIEQLQIRNDGAKFLIVDSLIAVVKSFKPLVARYGLSSELLKLTIKIMMKRNLLYIVIYDNVVVSDGLVSFGQCNHYKIDANDCVIGPVNTNPSYQKKGFATFGLSSSINYLSIQGNLEHIFIDTREDNFAMQKVIERCGFGKVIDTYNRN
ncbi:GNAT family N-acetyltransferase [Thalassotalea sediminis]|uniref:GNAT family N-acetyltransferase n=1 Tax=Thalassotalea sediminis TaxID=1759089 RepID=UPI0025747D3A|nr:GNAT family N-acetyltransferase [Thalassotalea sediminis]